MKIDKEKFKKFWDSKYRKPILFFGFYFFFFIFVFALTSSATPTNNNDAKENNNYFEVIKNNYEYQYEIRSSGNPLLTIEGKKYNNKNLYTIKKDNVIDKEVYVFYNKMNIKEDGTWVQKDTIDNEYSVNKRFLEVDTVLDYIKELTADAELIKTEKKFDETTSEQYRYGSVSIEVISLGNTLKKVVIDTGVEIVTLQYKNINKVNDFVVEK